MKNKILIALLLTYSSLMAQVPVTGSTVNAQTGFQYQGAAPSNQMLCGNGSLFLPSATCGAAANYQTLQSGGIVLPQRLSINFSSTYFALADDSGNNRTTVTLQGTLPVSVTGNAGSVGGVALSGLCQTGGTGCPITSRACNANGCYILYPDGTIHAWGNSAFASTGGSAQTLSITFPVSFTSTSNVHINVSGIGEPAGDGNPHPLDCHVASFTTSGATAVIAISTQVSGSGYDHILSSEYCSWMADGY